MSDPKPNHLSILESLDEVVHPWEFGILAKHIARTEIPEGHDDIVLALQKSAGIVSCDDLFSCEKPQQKMVDEILEPFSDAIINVTLEKEKASRRKKKKGAAKKGKKK